MPRLVIAFLTILVLGALAVTGLSAAPPTTEQLKAAILKPEDAGSDFITAFDGTFGDSGQVYAVQYFRLASSPGGVGALLADAALYTPEEAARSFIQGISLVANDASSETLPAPMIGSQPERRRFTAQVRGADLGGELIAWRQGEVLALVSLLGGAPERLLSLVERQQARLYVTFAPALTCATFAWQEEAQAVLALDPADPYKLDPTSSGVACAELAKRPPPAVGVVAAATPTPIATPAPAAAPTPAADPARALAGQTKDVCTAQNRLRTSIESAELLELPGGVRYPGIIILIVRVINLGPAIRNVPLWLVDAQNLGYSALPQRLEPESLPGMFPRERPAFDYSLLSLPPDVLRPPVNLEAGQNARVVAAFEVGSTFRPVGLWGGRQCPP